MIPYFNQKIWYAFQGLPVERVDSVDRLPWSKCLVLTNNIAFIIKVTQFTETFKKCISKVTAESNGGVTFDEYLSFLDTFQGINTNANAASDFQQRTLNADATSLVKNLDDYCWTLFRTKNMVDLSSQSSLSDGYFNLCLIFITYSIKNPVDEIVCIPVRMDLLEARYWCNRIKELLGGRRQFEDVEVEESVTEILFQDFYTMLQNLLKSVSLVDTVVDLALRELTEEALEGVTMKGPIKIDKFTRYCVLKSYFLMIYNNKISATNFRSCFVISGDTELLAGSNRIQMKSPGFSSITVINIEISDIQLFNKWRSAFIDAIEFAKSNTLNPAIVEAKKREEARFLKRSALRERRLNMEIKIKNERTERQKVTEAMKHQLLLADQKLDVFREEMAKELHAKELLLKENEVIREETESQIQLIIAEQQAQYKMQLEKLKEIEGEKDSLSERLLVTMEEKSNEEKKREMLEEKHLTEKQKLVDAQAKIDSLQELGEQLKKTLEDEKQAKEEEEVVLNATLALLEEEQRSKEKLEVLLQQQASMIDQEIQKRNEFAQALENERNLIKNIADEKEKLNKQLEETQQKMQSTGIRVRKLDTKVSQIAENIFGKEQTRKLVSHRGQGFLAEKAITKNNRMENCL